MRNLTNVFPSPSLNINSFLGRLWSPSSKSKQRCRNSVFKQFFYSYTVFPFPPMKCPFLWTFLRSFLHLRAFVCIFLSCFIHSLASLSNTRSSVLNLFNLCLCFVIIITIWTVNPQLGHTALTLSTHLIPLSLSLSCHVSLESSN